MNKAEMKQRTRQFALRVIKLVQRLPNDQVAKVLGNQLLRSGTSVGANYRAACRARSDAEFRAKLGIVEEEEGDESIYWLELIAEAGIFEERLLKDITREADELVAIVVASIRTSKRK